MGVGEVLGPISVTFPDPGPLLIELLLCRLFLQETETTLHLVPPLPLLTKPTGIILSQDGSVVDTQREMALIYCYAQDLGHVEDCFGLQVCGISIYKTLLTVKELTLTKQLTMNI